MRSTTNSAGDAGKSRYDGSWGSIGGVAGAGVLGGDDCGRMMLLPLYCCARAHGRTVSGRHGPNIDITEYRAEGGEEEAQGLRHATPKPRTNQNTSSGKYNVQIRVPNHSSGSKQSKYASRLYGDMPAPFGPEQ